LLHTVASQAAVAIENARLLEKEQRHVKQLEELRKISLKVTSTLDLHDVLCAIADHTNRILTADFTSISHYTEQQELDTGVYTCGTETPPPITNYKDLLDQIDREGQITIVDTEVERGMNPAPGMGIKLVVGVPIKYGGQRVGVMLVHYLHSHIFTETEEGLTLQIADLAAVAIENATRTELIADRERYMTMVGLAADLVHRINNRAGTIPIRAQLLEKKLNPADPKDQEILKGIKGIASDARALLDDSTEMEQVSETTVTPEPVNVDVGERLETIAGKLRVESPTNIEINRSIGANIPPVKAVAEELDHALWSVAYNGVEAMLPQGGGTITIKGYRVEREGKPWVEIAITDEGPGIPAEMRGRIFEPFHSTRDGKFRGFGLWRARQVIRKLGGTIELAPEEKTGTTFIISLPGSEIGGTQNESQ